MSTDQFSPRHEWDDHGADLWMLILAGWECSVEWDAHEGWDWLVFGVASGHVTCKPGDVKARGLAMRMAELAAEFAAAHVAEFAAEFAAQRHGGGQ